MNKIHIFALPPAYKSRQWLKEPVIPATIADRINPWSVTGKQRKRERESDPAAEETDHEGEEEGVTEEDEQTDAQTEDNDDDGNATSGQSSQRPVKVKSKSRTPVLKDTTKIQEPSYSYQNDPNTREQYRLSGLSAHEEIPPSPFPATSTDYNPHRNKLYEAAEILENIKPPLYHANDLRRTRIAKVSEREQHIAVLNTILHKCLMDNDFDRATHAFGLLLRATSLGPRMMHDRNVCGIGAEILLRRNNRKYGFDGDETDNDECTANEQRGQGETYISESSFRLVKQYYELLTIQFPMRPKLGLNQLNFWLAFYNIWIYQVCERSKRSKAKYVERKEREMADRRDAMDMDEEYMKIDSDMNVREQIRLRELHDAKEIASRLDDTISIPPLDKDPELVELSAMVARWMSDLVVPVHTKYDSDDEPMFNDGQGEIDAERRMHLEKEKGLLSRMKIITGIDAEEAE